MRCLALSAALLVLPLPLVASADELELQASAQEEPPADANIDRGFLLSTAATQPAGSLTVSNYEFFMVGATYSVTDDTQISALVAAPVGPFANFAGLSAKARILDRKAIQLAVQVGGGYHMDDQGGDAVFTAGGIGSYCLDADCQSLLTGNATWLTGTSGAASELSMGTVLLGASWIQALGPHFKLMFELIGNVNKDADATLSHTVLVNYGFRASSKAIAADIGFLRPLDLDAVDLGIDRGVLPVGIPFANFTYRIK
jgi:hypothetical protein